MSRTASKDGLRARMQRVAEKPRRRPAAAPARRETPNPAPRRTRLDTMKAWSAWELSEVPARRLQWFKALLRGR